METKEQKVSYRITVVKTEHDVPFVEKEYRKLVDEPDSDHKEIYGYLEVDTTKNVETQLFAQTVNDLDLSKLVVTINS